MLATFSRVVKLPCLTRNSKVVSCVLEQGILLDLFLSTVSCFNEYQFLFLNCDGFVSSPRGVTDSPSPNTYTVVTGNKRQP